MFLRQLISRTFIQAAFILLIVEGVFLAEKLSGFIEATMQYGGNTASLAGVMALSTPEIIDFAMPLALMIAVYRVLLDARENRELVTVASAGMSQHSLLGGVLIIGAVGQIIVLFVNGFLAPLALNTKRNMIFDIQNATLIRSITKAPEVRRFFDLREFTVVATKDLGENSVGTIFIHRPTSPDSWRIVAADKWQVTGPHENGAFSLELLRMETMDLKHKKTPKEGMNVGIGSAKEKSFLPSIRVGAFRRSVSLDNLVQNVPRKTLPEEWFLPEMVIAGNVLGSFFQNVQKTFAERMARAALCWIAALLALLAVTQSRRFWRYFAFPVAAGSMVVLDILLRSMLSELVIYGPQAIIFATIVGTATICSVLIWLANAGSFYLVQPAFERA